MKFDPTIIFIKSTMIKYFEKGLKPSIKVKIDWDATNLNNYKELIVIAIRTKAKTSPRPSSYI